MANLITSKYAYIDTFGADVVIARNFRALLSVNVWLANNGKAVFTNMKGDPMMVLGGLKDTTDHLVPGAPIGVDGLIYDASLSSLGAGDILIINFA
jgi:hypothetical protein